MTTSAVFSLLVFSDDSFQLLTADFAFFTFICLLALFALLHFLFVSSKEKINRYAGDNEN